MAKKEYMGTATDSKNMMITVNFENLDDMEREVLLDLIEKANAPKCKTWKPKVGESFYYISLCGTILEGVFNDVSTCDTIVGIGNYFRTKEAAQFEIERLKVIQQLKELGGSYENCREKTYWFLICLNEDTIRVTSMNSSRYGSVICFASKGEANYALKTIGHKRLLKYYFHVED